MSGFGEARKIDEPKRSQVSGLGDQNDSNFLHEDLSVLSHIEKSAWDRNQDE